MYNHTLRINGEFLASGQTLPADGTATGNGGVSRAGSMCGAAEVLVRAVSSVRVGAQKQLTLQLEHGDSEDALTPMPVSFARRYPEGLQAAPGDVLARLCLPTRRGMCAPYWVPMTLRRRALWMSLWISFPADGGGAAGNRARRKKVIPLAPRLCGALLQACRPADAVIAEKAVSAEADTEQEMPHAV